MTRTVAASGFGTLLSTIASSTSPAHGERSRPFDGAVARPQPRRWVAHALDGLLTWSERARQRRRLMQFDDHLLRDIGISRAEAIAETEKPFWRA